MSAPAPQAIVTSGRFYPLDLSIPVQRQGDGGMVSAAAMEQRRKEEDEKRRKFDEEVSSASSSCPPSPNTQIQKASSPGSGNSNDNSPVTAGSAVAAAAAAAAAPTAGPQWAMDAMGFFITKEELSAQFRTTVHALESAERYALLANPDLSPSERCKMVSEAVDNQIDWWRVRARELDSGAATSSSTSVNGEPSSSCSSSSSSAQQHHQHHHSPALGMSLLSISSSAAENNNSGNHNHGNSGSNNHSSLAQWRRNLLHEIRVRVRRQGISPAERAVAWPLFAGLEYDRASRVDRCMQLLLKRAIDPDLKDVMMRDLGRTLPTHSLFRGAASIGQTRLERVLHCYCALDPEVGYCLAVEDMELLTDTGFVGYAEAKRRFHDGSLVVAAFDQQTRQLVYERPTQFIDKPGAPDDGLYEITPSNNNNNVSIRVTGKHKLLRYLKNTDTFCKMTVEDIRAKKRVPGGSRDPSEATDIHLVGFPENGVCVADTLSADIPELDVMLPALAAARTRTNKNNGANNDKKPGRRRAHPQDDDDDEEEAPPASPTPEDIICRFLRLFGYWLGDGSLDARASGQFHTVFAPKKACDTKFVTESLALFGLQQGRDFSTCLKKNNISDSECERQQQTITITRQSWTRFFFNEFAAKFKHGLARAESQAAIGAGEDIKSLYEVQPESAKSLPMWAWRLSRARAANLLLGISDADGGQSPDNDNWTETTKNCCVYTSSPHFRDQLVRFSLHAGFYAHYDWMQFPACASRTPLRSGTFTEANVDRWCVSFSARAPQCKAGQIVKVEGYNKGTWCVSTPHENIVVRRIATRRSGAAGEANNTRSWRPLIISNCQGMGFIVSVLLLHMPEHDAFALFVQMMHSRRYMMRGLFQSGFPLLQRMLELFRRLLRLVLPQLSDHFDNLGIDPAFFASHWFLTLFSYQFAVPVVCRIWDLFLSEGWIWIFRVALALLMAEQRKLRELPMEEILMFVKSIHEGKSEEDILRLAKDIPIRESDLAAIESDGRGSATGQEGDGRFP